MTPQSRATPIVLIALAVAACAPVGAPTRQEVDSGSVARPETSGEAQRTLVAAVRVEPLTVAGRPLREQGVGVYLSGRIFNAELAILDDRGTPRPYLTEALPQLNTETWRVFPDGRMETTYRLKPNLTWHDGTPLSADDFVFSSRVYATPELSAGGRPMSLMKEVIAPDPHTLVVHWRQPYPDAESLTDRNAEFPPLPRHILEQAFLESQPEAFAHHPYWTTEYIGVGPFRLERWEPGAFIEGVAFHGHVLGRPKIQRIKVIFISDVNTALVNMLAGEVHLSADSSLAPFQAPTLRREWGPEGGAVLGHPNLWRVVSFQLRPELATPGAILDRVVRKALAHAVDKEAINDTVYERDALPSDAMIVPASEEGAAVDRAISKYLFDPRRTEQLMAEAGFRRGADGIYASPTEGRFSAELKTNAAADQEAEMAILASSWRQAGFAIQDAVLAVAQARDNQIRASFPGLFVFSSGVAGALFNLTSGRIPRPDNRWLGGNRGGWSNPEYDRLSEAFSTTMSRGERTQLLVEIARLYTEELPSIPLFFRNQVWAFVAGLRGPKVVPPESNMSWNIHEWEWR